MRFVTNGIFPPGSLEEQPHWCSAQPPAASRPAPLPQPPLCPEPGEGSRSLHGQMNQSDHSCRFTEAKSLTYSLTSSLRSTTARCDCWNHQENKPTVVYLWWHFCIRSRGSGYLDVDAAGCVNKEWKHLLSATCSSLLAVYRVGGFTSNCVCQIKEWKGKCGRLKSATEGVS